MPECKSCGAPIKFIKLPSGKMTPVEANEKKFYIESMGEYVLVPGLIPHWANCPDPDNFRNPKTTNQKIGPLSKREGG